MQVVYASRGDVREVDVRVNDPGATVGDLLAALDAGAGGAWGLRIGEREVGAGTRLDDAGLYEGAVLAPAAGAPATSASASDAAAGAPATAAGAADSPAGSPDTAADAPPDAAAGQAKWLEVVGGIDAGRRMGLPPGAHTLGRTADADLRLASPTVSARHARLDVDGERVTVTDLRSRNGTWVGHEAVTASRQIDTGQVVRLGAVELAVRGARDHDRSQVADAARHVQGAATVAFNRPPRAARPGPPPAVKTPRPPEKSDRKQPFNWVMLLAPIAFGGVLIWVMGSYRYALFMLLMPAMALGNWLHSRRTTKKTKRAEAARFRRELAEFTEALADRRAAEVARRFATLPDLPEVIRRARLPSAALWERRPDHEDFLRLRVGIGDVPWTPPVGHTGGDLPDEVADAIDAKRLLPQAPVATSLAEGGVVGIVGEREPSLALARSLLAQAAVHQGPANLSVAVLASEDAAQDWDWAKWLPHVRDPGGGSARLLGAGTDQSTELLDALVSARAPTGESVLGQRREGLSEDANVLLAVLDDESLTQGRRAPARSLLRGRAGPVAGIVLAETADRLPAVCSTVITCEGTDGLCHVEWPATGEAVRDVLAGGLAGDTARDCARALARYEDPELEVAGAGLPDMVRLLPLLDLGELTPEAVATRWKRGGRDPAPAAPIGVDEDGVFAVDLAADGPHGLIAGTTGSGKSELLRSLVAGLAASVDPDHLTFVLVDYKGGSAFDECARLPHTVGLVTDLDEHLGERALRCLEAELHHRERVLRGTGCEDLPAYRAAGSPDGPMPRLVVVIDEFATMAAELPDFMEALVGVAQRGRSLGVHLILATQRPQGAINDNIRANTNLRIALRVQDDADSTDVIGTGDAADISRGQAGRGYVRLGPSELVPIQTALSTAAAAAGSRTAPVDAAPFEFGPAPSAASQGGDDAGAETPDLTRLVQAVGEAFATSGSPEPRRPWPDPLPERIDLADVAEVDERGGVEEVRIALADDPEAQSQYPVGWRPGNGNLLVYGGPGSGTTTTLAAVALTLARAHTPDALHLYVLDFGAGELSPLAELPHAGAAIDATDTERQLRLLRFLAGELDRRRQLPAAQRRAQPRLVVLLDGFAAFRSAYDDASGMEVVERFQRVFADGPEVGMLCLASGDRAGAVPTNFASVVRQKLVMGLADPSEYGMFGIRSASVPAMTPGRALRAETGQELQVGTPGALADEVAAIAEDAPPAEHGPYVVRRMPSCAPVDDAMVRAASVGAGPWTLPVGIAEADLAPAALTLYPGEHATVAGSARSGKTTLLQAVAALVARAAPHVVLVGVAGPRSRLGEVGVFTRYGTPDELAALLGPVDEDPRPHLLVVDDADQVDDDGTLAQLLRTGRDDVHVVIAGRIDGLRGRFSHWTKHVRDSRIGALLQPNVDLDNDLLGIQLPRRAPVALTTGRGYLLVDGEAVLIQAASPGEPEGGTGPGAV